MIIVQGFMDVWAWEVIILNKITRALVDELTEKAKAWGWLRMVYDLGELGVGLEVDGTSRDGVISKYIIDFFSQSCFDTSAIHFVTHLS